jgi:hypothetical protein
MGNSFKEIISPNRRLTPSLRDNMTFAVGSTLGGNDAR